MSRQCACNIWAVRAELHNWHRARTRGRTGGTRKSSSISIAAEEKEEEEKEEESHLRIPMSTQLRLLVAIEEEGGARRRVEGHHVSALAPKS